MYWTELKKPWNVLSELEPDACAMGTGIPTGYFKM